MLEFVCLFARLLACVRAYFFVFWRTSTKMYLQEMDDDIAHVYAI